MKNKKRFITCCAQCKRVKVDEKSWVDFDPNLHSQTSDLITHGLCEACAEILFDRYLESAFSGL